MTEADDDSDTEMATEDPWDSVVQKAFDQCQNQFDRRVTGLLETTDIDDTEARKRTYLDMRHTYRKAVSGIFTARMLWFRAMRKQSVYAAIEKMVRDLVDLDDYGLEEAWKSAVGQRKYLFDTILARYHPPGLDEEWEEMDVEEPPAKRARV